MGDDHVDGGKIALWCAEDDDLGEVDCIPLCFLIRSLGGGGRSVLL